MFYDPGKKESEENNASFFPGDINFLKNGTNATTKYYNHPKGYKRFRDC